MMRVERNAPYMPALNVRVNNGDTSGMFAVLRRTLDEVREKGYALDDEEYDEGVRCVAVAVVGSPGREPTAGAPVAALSISAPASRLSRQRCAELAPVLRRAAAELADALRDQAGAAS